MLGPYDYTSSLLYQQSHGSLDQCAEPGFVLQTRVSSWRGTPGTAVGNADEITSYQIVRTLSSITAFDDFGRVIDSTILADLATK